MHKALSDGFYLSKLYTPRRDEASAITVRVIEYALPGTDGAQTRYRLLTSLLNEKSAPALELAALYHERWEVEAVFDELKTHLLQRRRVLRSKTPNPNLRSYCSAARLSARVALDDGPDVRFRQHPAYVQVTAPGVTMKSLEGPETSGCYFPLPLAEEPG